MPPATRPPRGRPGAPRQQLSSHGAAPEGQEPPQRPPNPVSPLVSFARADGPGVRVHLACSGGWHARRNDVRTKQVGRQPEPDERARIGSPISTPRPAYGRSRPGAEVSKTAIAVSEPARNSSNICSSVSGSPRPAPIVMAPSVAGLAEFACSRLGRDSPEVLIKTLRRPRVWTTSALASPPLSRRAGSRPPKPLLVREELW